MKALSSTASRIAPQEPEYDSDFLAWTKSTAVRLRHRQWASIDIEHVAEEIEDMGKRDVDELCSRMEVLIAHLLKWLFQPRRRSRSWRVTIVAQRLEIHRLLRRSPSLRRHLTRDDDANYRGALKLAAAETGLNRAIFPTNCPFTLEQILDEDFFPPEVKA